MNYTLLLFIVVSVISQSAIACTMQSYNRAVIRSLRKRNSSLFALNKMFIQRDLDRERDEQKFEINPVPNPVPLTADEECKLKDSIRRSWRSRDFFIIPKDGYEAKLRDSEYEWLMAPENNCPLMKQTSV